jgi:uncharacterized protein YndB with AHSA1/START domain
MSAKSVSPKRVTKAVPGKTKNLSLTFTVDKSPARVFAAINNVRGWWSEDLEGTKEKVGDRFKYHYKKLHDSTQTVTELVPNKRVVWNVSNATLHFLKDKHEWNGTDCVFEISKKGDKTQVKFTHVGLAPTCECYEACSVGWGY